MWLLNIALFAVYYCVVMHHHGPGGPGSNQNELAAGARPMLSY